MCQVASGEASAFCAFFFPSLLSFKNQVGLLRKSSCFTVKYKKEHKNTQKIPKKAVARQGRIDRIRALIESGRASATDRDGDGIIPSHLAVITGRVPAYACAYLIEQVAEVNMLGGIVPATPLQRGARKGLVEVIDLLINHGANPLLVDPQDFSCVHSIMHSSIHWALLYILCQPDITVDERDHLGLTPLHWGESSATTSYEKMPNIH